MASITDNPEKMAIVERLVRESAIDFAEAIKLLEREVECTPISLPFVQIVQPWAYPTQPFYPVVTYGSDYQPEVTWTSKHN